MFHLVTLSPIHQDGFEVPDSDEQRVDDEETF